MRSYITIHEALPQLMNSFNWFHSFIREVYFTSECCFSEIKRSTEATIIGVAGLKRNLRMMVAASGNPMIFGIEFLCFDVEMFSLQRLIELKFDCEFDNKVVKLNFLSTDSDNHDVCRVIAKDVRVAFLGKEYLGPFLRLGYEAPRDDAISAIGIGECWRQCANCYNAWVEKPDIEYSRCPECGQLTRLTGSE